jgi:transglutaminase superfamily protein
VADAHGSTWRRWPATIGALSWRDRGLLVETLAIVSTLPLVLRAVRVQRLTGTLGRSLDGRRPAGRVDEPRARQIARIVAMASRHTLTANTCLHRSLALWWVLGRRGLDSHLKMGARLNDGRLDAHAWVEHSGVVINDDPEVTGGYTPLSGVTANTVGASVSELARTERGIGAPARERVGGAAGAKPPGSP